MANSMVRSTRNMKRTDSKKPHSWWWDSHISPKNSKWLAENLEEMDQSVKRMLKLIEEDGDSFAKKAEMYYQKRPELISHVEEFYRMYRSLAERYDHLTGELRKNIPSDLQSQGSGISDVASELPSTWPSPDQRLPRRKSGPRAAGFDVFLGSAGSSTDVYQKEGDESSSLTDSEPDSDDSSVNNYSVLSGNGGDQGLNRRMIEMEIELREAKEKIRMQQDDHAEGSVRGGKFDNGDDFLTRTAGYEQELRIANEKTKLSEDEIRRLRMELQKYKSRETAELDSTNDKNVKTQECERTAILEEEIQNSDGKLQALVEEMSTMKERLQDSDKEIATLKLENKKSSAKIQTLQGQLELAQKDVATWKSKLNTEKREVSKLQERIARLKTSLSDRDTEIRDLKLAVSDAEEKIFPEKAQIKAEISKLMDERTDLVEQLREWESRGRSLEEEIRKIVNEKRGSEERLLSEIEQLKEEIAGKDDCLKSLNEELNELKTVRDELKETVNSLREDLNSRDDRIDQMNNHLHQLHKEHVELIASAAGARKVVEELKERAKELEEEVEKQKMMILEGAEEKREAIRQLCFSLEHYRNGYHRLRQAFMGHKRVPVLAA